MFLIAVDGAMRLERDQIVILARAQQRAMDVGAMRHRVGILKALRKALVRKRNADDRLAREGTAHLHGGRTVSVGEHRILQSDLVKRPENIGAELDAGADLAELRGLLKNANRKALHGQGIARGEPADAAASDENGLP